jgi:hypothetical protein
LGKTLESFGRLLLNISFALLFINLLYISDDDLLTCYNTCVTANNKLDSDVDANYRKELIEYCASIECEHGDSDSELCERFGGAFGVVYISIPYDFLNQSFISPPQSASLAAFLLLTFLALLA